ncbi:hypothetical protein FA13DRAFT_1733110 [Coprinellus micaceus]|uniref:DUF6533 domain-containing protein n=1 Tax=Coprinellus micaceus TaxID=71717 RepID=A0A4Y7TB68_COPMI|nr:hypothetical protein FA13DRAFT_1733110 [Coprinellus micaceus]
MSIPLEDLPETLEYVKLNNYFNVAGMAVMLVDYLHTLQEEERFIWPAKLSIANVLLLLVRYGNFVLAVTTSFYTFDSNLSLTTCHKLSIGVAMQRVLLLALGEAVMYLRVWAFSGEGRRALYILAAVYTTVVTLGVVLVVVWDKSATVVAVSQLPGFSCMYVRAEKVSLSIILMQVVMLASILCLVIATIAIGISRYRNQVIPSRRMGGLLLQFYQGGVLHFIALLGLSVGNLLSENTAINLQVQLHGIIVTRIVLQMRKFSAKNGFVNYRRTDGVGLAVAERRTDNLTSIGFASASHVKSGTQVASWGMELDAVGKYDR